MEWSLGVIFLALSLAMTYVAVLYCALCSDRLGIFVGGDKMTNYSYTGTVNGYECEIEFNHLLRFLISKDDYLLSNVILDNRGLQLCEIDSILVSRKGLFCIEIKCNRGSCVGRSNSQKWTFHIGTKHKRKNKIENPVILNEKHCDILEKTLDFRYISDNIVVFPNIEGLVNFESKNAFTTDTFLKCYNSLEEDQLTKKDILKIVDKLSANVSIFHSLQNKKRVKKERMSYFQLP